MRKIALLLISTLCSATLLVAAQDQNNSSTNPKEMIGWVCNAKCVDQSSGKPTCNQNCSEAAGEVVFIQENGQVTKIANQEIAQPMAGKKCKIKAKKDPNSGRLAVQNIIEYGG
jgi:hypothetical protein